MSRKSRQPETGSRKRGKNAKGGDPRPAGAHVVARSQAQGVPFGVVVVFGAVLAAPSLSNHLAGALTFEALMMRVFAALAVAWLLSHLVFAVFTAMHPADGASDAGDPEGSDGPDGPDTTTYDGAAGHGTPLSGTIVGDDDPYALPPMGDSSSLPPLTPLEAGLSGTLD